MARLLLLEDDLDLADVVTMLLSNDGHEVQSTPNGRQALLLAEQGGWDLVILDIDVEELSGLAVARAIGDFAHFPTLVYSAGVGSWQRDAFRAGAAACLQKPFEMSELRALISTLVGIPKPGEETQVGRLSADDLDRVLALTPEELDALPFGVIQVDRSGIVVGYNQYESAAALQEPAAVLGRPFAELAPCTQVKAFSDAVAECYSLGSLDRVLRLVFPLRGALTVVSVRLYFDPHTGRMWIFVSRRLPQATDRLEAHGEPATF
jgi:photoactive yellow protein